MLDEGQLNQAHHCFDRARSLNDPEPVYGLAMASLAQGDLATSEDYLRRAVWMAETSPRATTHHRRARFRFSLGDVLARKGDVAGAAEAFQRAIDAVMDENPMGASWGLSTGYTWFVFHREAIVDELLPGVIWITVTDEVEDRMWQLAEWYEALGRYADAARTYRELAEAVPDRPEATKRVNVLLSETGPRWRW
jgi:tetratricopeptide (TPR) repeat protein